ncbi:cytochrome [Streptomyces sp. NRRL F-4489]|uniref:cytochrome P450 n=1 Tax=Streptomyces sp. NRRL F-4489 TaxID=1609095 RepID=UPI000746547F|nr:cytochrome [Streptomyces sp. NRRL F-4489]
MTEQQHPTAGGCPFGAGAAGPGGTEAVPLYGAGLSGDPARLYREMRARHGAVAPILLDGDIPGWFVMGYRELHQVTSNPELFARDSRRWHAWERIPEGWPLLPFVGYQPSVMFAEGPEHRRRAGAISDALTAIDQFELRQICERLADGLIDAFAGSGEADLMARYAARLPLLVIAELFGFPHTEVPELAADIAASLNEDEGAIAAHQRVAERMARLVKAKRERPGADVPSRLLAHPAGLAEEEVVIDLLVVMAAAQQPTANWIGNTLRLMLTDDRFALSLTGGRRSVGQALNEVLWHDTPTQNFIGRWAVRDTQLGGRRIRTGDLLILGLAAANSDPQVRPDFTDAGSDGNQAHMSFSHGEHACPYPAPEIAEVIAKAAVEVLLDRLPDVMLAVPDAELAWHPSLWMRGLVSLPVEFTPTYTPIPAVGAGGGLSG